MKVVVVTQAQSIFQRGILGTARWTQANFIVLNGE